MIQSVTPTVTVSASPDYAAGDNVSGILTLPGAVWGTRGSTRLVSVTVKDKAGQAPPITIYFFKSSPVGTFTDNAAIVWGTGDAGRMIGSLVVQAADYKTLAGVSLASFGDINQIMKSDTSDLYAVVEADGAYNAAATDDLTVEFGFDKG